MSPGTSGSSDFPLLRNLRKFGSGYSMAKRPQAARAVGHASGTALPRRRAVSIKAPLRTTPRTVTATEAARRFAALVDEVRRTGRSMIVTQHGRPVCRIAPAPEPESTIDTLIEALASGPRVDSEFLETVEAITRTQPRLPRSPWDE